MWGVCEVVSEIHTYFGPLKSFSLLEPDIASGCYCYFFRIGFTLKLELMPTYLVFELLNYYLGFKKLQF